MFLDGLSGELRGGEVAEGLQREVAHVGLLVGEVGSQEVAGPHLEARVTAEGRGRGREGRKLAYVIRGSVH